MPKRPLPMPPVHGRPAMQWAALLGASAGLSVLLQALHVPAALLLGPMLCAVAAGVGGATIRLPRPAFLGAQGVIGAMIAHAITPALLLTVARDWPAMVFVVLTTIASASAVSWALARWGSLPGSVAAWGLSPGAASAMVALAEEFGSDARIVAFMQYVRAVCVVVSASLVTLVLAGPGGGSGVPPAAVETGTWLDGAATVLLVVAGILAGRLLRLPSGALLGPMIIGAVLHAAGLLTIVLPPAILAIAYAAVGWYVGLRFTRSVVRLVLRTIPQILLATMTMIALGAVSAWLLTRLLGIDFLTAYLATSPGGLDSVAIIAVGMPVDISFILALQTLRLFLVILTGPVVARFVARTAPVETGADRN